MRLEAPIEETRTSRERHSPNKEAHWLEWLIIFSRHRRTIIWFTIGAALLSTATVFLLPSRYTAETVVLPPAQSSSMNSVLQSSMAGSGALASLAGSSLGIKNPGDMYVSLFRSESVENSLVRRFDLMARYHKHRMSDARQSFEDRSSVTLGAKDGLIRIAVTDKDPGMAAEIANAYVDEFRKLSANLAVSEAAQRRVFFQQQLLEANQNLAAAEEAMKNAQLSSGILQLDSQARSLIESASILRGQIAAKEVEIQAMRSYATSDNPQIVLAEEQLAGLRSQLAKLSGSATNSGSDIIVPKGAMPKAGIEYLNGVRNVRYYETVEELIAKQFELAKLDEARQGTEIQVVDPAIRPDKRSFPRRTLSVLLATAFGLLFGCGWSLATHGFQRMKNNSADRARLEQLRASLK